MKPPKWTLDTDKDMLTLFLSTWGSPPKDPERIEVQKHIVDKFGWDRAYEIMYWSQLKGFHKILTLIEELDDKGNIKSKKPEATGRVIIDDAYKTDIDKAKKESKGQPKIEKGWLTKGIKK